MYFPLFKSKNSTDDKICSSKLSVKLSILDNASHVEIILCFLYSYNQNSCLCHLKVPCSPRVTVQFPSIRKACDAWQPVKHPVPIRGGPCSFVQGTEMSLHELHGTLPSLSPCSLWTYLYISCLNNCSWVSYSYCIWHPLRLSTTNGHKSNNSRLFQLPSINKYCFPASHCLSAQTLTQFAFAHGATALVDV